MAPKKIEKKRTVKKRGMPPHIPTDETIEFVKCCVIAGIDRDIICRLLGIRKTTYHKHYKEHIEAAKPGLKAALVKSMIARALSGDPKADATRIYLCKVLLGWRENDTSESSGMTPERYADIVRSTVEALTPGTPENG